MTSLSLKTNKSLENDDENLSQVLLSYNDLARGSGIIISYSDSILNRHRCYLSRMFRIRLKASEALEVSSSNDSGVSSKMKHLIQSNPSILPILGLAKKRRYSENIGIGSHI